MAAAGCAAMASQARGTSSCEGMGASSCNDVLARAGLEVEMVSCLGDNYCPILHHAASGCTMVVDTPEAGPILEALRQRGWSATHILNTHHHDDHVGGNLELKAAFPDVKIIGPHDQEYSYPGPYPPPGVQKELIPGVDLAVKEGDDISLGALRATVLEVGGHTASHIAYFFPEVPLALTGDCLFTLGCGRVFTGDYGRMQASLNKLRSLPDETVVFCAHEYTTPNLEFALKVEPQSSALRAREAEVRKLRAEGRATVPTILGFEKATNPFLRWDAPEVQEAAGGLKDPVEVFTFIRKWKDTGNRPSAAQL